MKRVLFRPRYIPGIEDVESYKYTFNSAADCGWVTFYIGLYSFILSEILLDLMLLEQLILLLVVLMFGVWIPFFRICYFYTDRIVVFFPFHAWKRIVCLYYTDIQYFKWSKSDMIRDRLRPVLENASKREERRAKLFYSIPIQHNKRFYFLLKFLYDRDCPTTCKMKSDTEDAIFSCRINYLFGFAETRPSRPYHMTPQEKKIEREAFLFIVFINLIIAAFIFFMFKIKMQ